MLKNHHRFFKLIFQIGDLIVVAASWVLAYYARFYTSTFSSGVFKWATVTKGIPPFHDYFLLTSGIVVVWFLSFSLSGVYRSRRTESFLAEVAVLFRATVISFLALVAGAYFFTGDLFSRGVLLYFFVLSLIGVVLYRLAVRTVLKALRRRGYNRRYALIVGDNEVGAGFYDRVKAFPELGIEVIGVIEVPDAAGAPKVKRSLSRDCGVERLGGSHDLERILRSRQVDQLVLAIRNHEQSLLDEILSVALDFNLDIRVVPDLHQYVTLGCEVEEFEGLPLITLNQSPVVGWDSVAKRVSDVVYACLALLVFTPLMALIGLLIKVFTPGPVFYRQPRMGLDGQVFDILKFRSMSVNAEASTGAVWAVQNDSRVTWLGAILRKTSLDELPQFINVLRGEMSCVGPRPERPELVEKFKKDIPKYMLRHKVKAGITGWAQINGWRGNTSLEKRIEYDLYYISNWSLVFDFKIMILTVFKGFIGKNAY